jgi:hypothetical protein
LGSWARGTDTTAHPVHATVLRDGRIMYMQGSGLIHSNINGPYKAAVIDLNANTETVTVLSEDQWCGGFSQLAEGTILIVGGTTQYDDGPDGRFHGANYAYEFDVNSGTFNKINSMAHASWYPSMGTLPNGQVYVMTGLDEFGATNELLEVFDPATKTFTITYDPSSSLTYCVGGIPSGQGGICYGGPNSGVHPGLGLYARTIIMPSGLVFVSGQTRILRIWNPSTHIWSTAGTMVSPVDRIMGTSVLLPLQNTASERGKILVVGGQDPASTNVTNTAELLDFNAGSNTLPVVTSTTSMTYARMYPLPVLLPTGKVIIFGGTSDSNVTPVYYPELFDPVNNTWTILPPATIPRQYHSVALLLPDGRIWTAAGSPSGFTFTPQTEFFSPWYLFAGPRPTISGQPTVGPYGGTISIPTPNASSIALVSLLRMGNTTHHFDAEHRLVWLQIQSTSSSGMVVSAPINANIAPPGYYMIHILDGNGVPSPAKIIHIGHNGNTTSATQTGTSTPQNQTSSPPQNATQIFNRFLHSFTK